MQEQTHHLFVFYFVYLRKLLYYRLYTLPLVDIKQRVKRELDCRNLTKTSHFTQQSFADFWSSNDQSLFQHSILLVNSSHLTSMIKDRSWIRDRTHPTHSFWHFVCLLNRIHVYWFIPTDVTRMSQVVTHNITFTREALTLSHPR